MFSETVWYFHSHGLYRSIGMTTPFRKIIYNNASWGLAASGYRKPDQAGCAVVFPWFPRPHIFTADVSFEVWQKRSIPLWYRYGKRTCCGLHLVPHLKQAEK